MAIPPVLETVFGSLSDGVVLSDGGRIAYLNPAARRLLGLAPDAESPETVCAALCGRLTLREGGDAASACPLRDAADPRAALTIRGRHEPPGAACGEEELRRAAAARDLRVRCLRLPATSPGDREGLHLTFIEDASSELELERRKEDWRSMIVHDIRAPLSNVYGAVRELQDEAEEAGTTAGAEPLRIAVRNCRRMMGLLDLYLDLARLDAGLMPVAPRDLDAAPLVAAAVEEQSYLGRERGVTIETAVAPGLRVRADPALLARVLQNLLHNALKFSPEGGVVRLRAQPVEPGRAAFTVANDGAPIPPEAVPLLFRRFSQPAGAGPGRGAGLGLAFCREALKAMDGEVSVSSSAGAGTAFTVVLPRAGLTRSAG
ncbi:MAG: PAS domain-containing sensor histidine kinase [Elusimicrobiota bacterium]|nr:PAS domain-containing sensor histidine kinase [Elusimicrobiota bacterium]